MGAFKDEAARAGALCAEALWERWLAEPSALAAALESGRATAVACSNDFIALALAERLDAMGVTVPGTLSLAGFDGLAATRYCRPPLTTIRQEFYRIGLAASDLIHHRWDQPDLPPMERRIPPVAVPRAGIAPWPPAKGPMR